MSTGSRVPAVIDYLVATFQAAATLGQATPPVLVLDGPAVLADPAPLSLWVGVDDPDSATAPVAASSTQDRGDMADMGGLARNEQLSIHCTAQAWSGTEDVKTVRVSAAGIVAAVEALLITDQHLGGNLLLTDPGVTGAEWRQMASTVGPMVRITFTIDGKTKIGA